MKEKKSYIVSDKLMFKLALLGFDIVISYFIRNVWTQRYDSIFISFLNSFFNVNLILFLTIGFITAFILGFVFLNEKIDTYCDEREKFDSIRGERYSMSIEESLKLDLQIYEYQLKLAFEKEDYLEVSRIKKDITEIERKISLYVKKENKDL